MSRRNFWLLVSLIFLIVACTTAVLNAIVNGPRPNFDYKVEKNPSRKRYLIKQECERRARIYYDHCVESSWKEPP